jgi:hypothetical protein
MPNAIAVVAHHDDHVLWMAGVIQRLAKLGWHWTIIAMCVTEENKKNYFIHSCTELGAVPITMEFTDYQDGAPFSQNRRSEMLSNLLDAVRGQVFDLVFTHSRSRTGEYWAAHANHFEVRDLVKELVMNNNLGHGLQSLGFFSYDVIYGSGTATCAKPDADYFLQLTYPELLLKCQLCNSAPDADTNLRNLGYPCPNPEGFNGEKLTLPDPFKQRQ